MTRNDRLQNNLERLCADGERRFGKPGASFGAAAMARSLPLSHATSKENARQIYESGCLKPLSSLVAEGILEHRPDRVEMLLGTADSVFFYVGAFSYPATACGFLFSAAMEEAHCDEGSASPFDSGGLVAHFDWPAKYAEPPKQFLERHELPIPGHRRYLDLCLESLFAGPEGYFAGETIAEDPIGLQGGDAIRRRMHEVRIPARIEIRTPHLQAVFAPANLIAAHPPLRLSLACEPGGKPLPPVLEFIRSVPPEKLGSLKPKFGEVGRLDVLAPDTDRDYTARLSALALQNLEREAIIDLGQRLHRYFKEQRFDLRPLGLEDFEEAVKTPYDYILIDSRTGFTEIGGLCVGPLADRLVVVTGLNDQNVSGTVHFLREVGIDSPPSEKRQPWDDADALAREADSLGPKPTIVVASPVPAGEIEFKRERLDVLEKKIGIKPLRVSYHPRLALMETIFVRDFDDEPPALDYRRLADQLAAQVDDNADRLILDLVGSAARGALKPESAIRLPSQRPEAALLASAVLFRDDVGAYYQRRMAAMLHDADTGRFTALINWANALAKEGGARARHSADYFRRAFDRYSEATLINPASAEVFHNWGSALYDFASTVRGPQAVALLEQSVEKFARAVDLDPGSAPAFFGWGNALSSLAERSHLVDAGWLFQQSFEKYSKAVQSNPGFAEAYANWGLALAQFAAISDKATASLFEQAFEKFSEALRAKPNFVPVRLNWAMALAKFAQTLPGEEADRRFREALEKCAEAVQATSVPAYLHWGEILRDFAITKHGPMAEPLFLQSLDKYEQAARMESDSVSVLAGWGRALMSAGFKVRGQRAEHFLAEARQKLGRAGVAGLFDLACLDALQRDVPSSIARLREALAEGIDFADEMEGHKEFFDPIRDHPDFAAFLAQLPTYGNRGSIPNPGPSGTR